LAKASWPLTLRSERLTLREFVPDDWEAVHRYATLPDVFRYQPWGPNTPADSRSFVAEIMASARVEPRARFALAVTGVGSGSFFGTAEINVRNRDQRAAEIAYVLHPDYWGQGLATEAANLLVAYGFGELGLHRIFATCDPRNVASAKVLRKAGMTYEGRMRAVMLIRDGWRDSDLFSILEHEFSGSNG
jgi:ribosomal-protein-alanine N-acetyltransferase